MENNKYIIISLGGSLIVPNKIDSIFLKKFILMVKDYTNKGYHFVIITGGGKTCREYNSSLKEIVKPTNEDLDWMGISATRLNAELVRISFADLAYEKVLLNPDLVPQTDKLVIVGGGWKPGSSSDLDAVRSAKSVGASKLINLSNRLTCISNCISGCTRTSNMVIKFSYLLSPKNKFISSKFSGEIFPLLYTPDS